MKTAVALMVFNRPALTRRVFEAVARARPPVLLIVADGPRPDRETDRALCADTQAVVDAVNWPCRVERLYAERNLGCRKRIATGLDWVFSRVDEAIILEDDCLPDPSFFPYAEELLARYRDDPRIHMIRGGNFLGGRRVTDASYYFSRWYHIWGWASWARAWRFNDVAMQRWPALRDSGWLESFLPLPAMVQRAREIFDDSHAGRIDTWEYEWVFSSWVRGALAISPARNLVTNIGFAPDAAHGTNPQHPHAQLPTTPMAWPLAHPGRVAVHERADRLEWELTHPHLVPPPLHRRIAARLRRFATRLRAPPPAT